MRALSFMAASISVATNITGGTQKDKSLDILSLSGLRQVRRDEEPLCLGALHLTRPDERVECLWARSFWFRAAEDAVFPENEVDHERYTCRIRQMARRAGED
jgi:hypothetical protein